LEASDVYKTIAFTSPEILYKEKSSKFFGYAFPFESEDDLKPILENLRKKHPQAGHFCYAYQIGTTKKSHRANDDGEPSNSAGMPIFGQIQSFDLTNVLVVVARVFGGTKLGVGGLISAYKTAAQETLLASEIITKTIDVKYLIEFDYKNINTVMRLIKEKNITIIAQTMQLQCAITIAVRQKNAQNTFDSFKAVFGLKISLAD
jgi:uncharacterized YigZ family protein